MSYEPLSETRVVALLESLADEVAFPETPRLASSVRARLDLPESTVNLQSRVPWRRRRLVPVAVGVMALALGLSFAFSATARRAAADLFGIVGIEITFDEPDTPLREHPQPSPLDPTLDLGAEVTRAQAEDAVGFSLRGPDARRGPVVIYLDPTIGDSGMVSTVFERPQRGPILITEFRASVEGRFIKKTAGAATKIRSIAVGDADGYWLSGEPHFFAYLAADGSLREESIRLAGNVLLWDSDGITYRIEGLGSLGQAHRLASALGF